MKVKEKFTQGRIVYERLQLYLAFNYLNKKLNGNSGIYLRPSFFKKSDFIPIPIAFDIHIFEYTFYF